MRAFLVFALTLSAVVFGATTLARGEDPDPQPEPAPAAAAPKTAVQAVLERVELLEKEVQYLRSREEALTQYVLANELRSKGLAGVASRARSQGFENRAIPAPSRVTLLAGMEQLAQSLVQGLPQLSEDEQSLLAQIEKLRAKLATPKGE